MLKYLLPLDLANQATNFCGNIIVKLLMRRAIITILSYKNQHLKKIPADWLGIWTMESDHSEFQALHTNCYTTQISYSNMFC